SLVLTAFFMYTSSSWISTVFGSHLLRVAESWSTNYGAKELQPNTIQRINQPGPASRQRPVNPWPSLTVGLLNRPMLKSVARASARASSNVIELRSRVALIAIRASCVRENHQARQATVYR